MQRLDLRVKSDSPVLVVERAAEVRTSAARLIEEMGYEIAAAEDEGEAADLAARLSPGLIIANGREPLRVEVGRPNPSPAARVRDASGLGPAVTLLTHSETSITVSGGERPEATYSDARQLILLVPRAGEVDGARECFAYTGTRRDFAKLLGQFLATRSTSTLVEGLARTIFCGERSSRNHPTPGPTSAPCSNSRDTRAC
jgi:CheY-like chemotaxis protein